ncbi:hypothetical protein PVL29_005264 [Vitis rotundifolia]|nr:hypothetical protein PVL29_005264 [Vitis rotundifolia]
MAASPFLRLQNFCISEVCAGRVIASWVCFFAFGPHHPPILDRIPPILMISRNPKLASIPALANDLQIIFELGCRLENKEPSHVPYEEIHEPNKDDQSKRTLFMFDLNCPPCLVATPETSENQGNDKEAPGIIMKKKRAASEDVAKIALEDLVKYFDVPMVEASRNLKIGLTVLKRKCREFGIPRWPHRKIKSLDGLIRDLQEEAERQQLENKAAAMAVLKRQRMLETEKECIEQRPFMEIEDETKRFRQDVFKRRHRARALKNRG